MRRQIVRYSEAFKMQVVSELESGAIATITEARECYDIRGGSTVQNWLKKYGKDHLRSRVVTVQTPKDRDETKALKKRVKQLEKALADSQVKAVLNEAYYHIVCEDHGIPNPEEYKKKLDKEL
jgi:transposase